MRDRQRRGSRAGKRLLDIILASCGLIAASPLMLVVALAIRTTMGSPVLFRQQRPGLHGRPFVILKFRSMVNPRNQREELLDPDKRLTRLGYWLRRTSLDELPELWNVVRGDMSLVGPRPLLMEYLPRYSADQMRRHEVPPGITGLAQVRGRHAVGWDERFSIDTWYVDEWSLRLDAEIILDTLRVLLKGQGIPHPESKGYFFTGTGDEVIGTPIHGDGQRQAPVPSPAPNGAATHEEPGAILSQGGAESG